MAGNNCGCCGGNQSAKNDDIRQIVKKTYGHAAQKAREGAKSSCCSGGRPSVDIITRDLYTEAETQGIPEEALLASLGCANPIALAELKPGETVLDLGSGGGIDVLLSARRVGPQGKAYGLDMTDEMLELARANQKKAGIDNVEFIKGEIENIPLPDNSVDVIISNCVINLSPDKDSVLKEAFRVLKPGGRFAVADIIFTKPVTKEIQDHVPLWTGCIAGALESQDYIGKLTKAGFEKPEVQIVRTYSVDDTDGLIPQEVIERLGPEQVARLMQSFASAFIRARKPLRGCCCNS